MGPCCRAINIIRKTKHCDLNYSTRTKLINPINTKILNILHNIHFLDNLIYLFIGIELSGPHTLLSLFKKLQIIYVRKDDRTVTRDFIIQKKNLDYINAALLLKQSRNVDINVFESSPATNFGIFGVVGIGNQTLFMIRTKCNICSIIDRILTY